MNTLPVNPMARGPARAFVFALTLMFALASSGSSLAGPPPPPGGHIRVHYGGYNGAGYPVTTAVPEPKDVDFARLRVLASPNPFRNSLVLRYAARLDEPVRVRFYAPTGRLVRQWAGRASQSGWQELRWDARDDRGMPVGVGVYLFRVQAGARIATGRVVLLH